MPPWRYFVGSRRRQRLFFSKLDSCTEQYRWILISSIGTGMTAFLRRESWSESKNWTKGEGKGQRGNVKSPLPSPSTLFPPFFSHPNCLDQLARKRMLRRLRLYKRVTALVSDENATLSQDWRLPVLWILNLVCYLAVRNSINMERTKVVFPSGLLNLLWNTRHMWIQY